MKTEQAGRAKESDQGEAQARTPGYALERYDPWGSTV